MRWIRLRAVVAAGMFGVLAAAPCPIQANSDNTPRIWFAPRDPRGLESGSLDFLDLFQDNAPWQRAAALAKVFKLTPRFLTVATDDVLGRVLLDLKRRHIALAAELGVLHPTASCGQIEGYMRNQLELAQRIRRLGGDLRFVAADEPLYFGHSFDGKAACRTPLAALAQDAAGTARQIRSVFPDVRIIDIEPISNFKEANWDSLVAEWLTAFRDAYGEPFAAFDIDIDWGRPWQDRVATITAQMRRANMRIGVIYNGNPKDPTDAAWLDAARQHYTAYEALVGGPPDDVIFQSWVVHPTRVLPESSPDAFTHLLLEYARSHPGVPRP